MNGISQLEEERISGSEKQVVKPEPIHAPLPNRKEGPPEIITDYAVYSAGKRDFGQTIPSLERLESAGRMPEVLVGDSHYVSGPLLSAARSRGVELLSPAGRGNLPKDLVGRDQFVFSETTGDMLECPQGHAPIGHMLRTSDKGRKHSRHVKLDRERCSPCPLRGRCVARPPNSGKGHWHLDICRDLRLRDANLAAQGTDSWKKRYRIRSGIEATNSELKRRHGLGKLRVRRRPNLRLAVAAKLTACNVKRWLSAV